MCHVTKTPWECNVTVWLSRPIILLMRPVQWTRTFSLVKNVLQSAKIQFQVVFGSRTDQDSARWRVVRSYYEFIFPLVTLQPLQQPLAYGRRLSSSPLRQFPFKQDRRPRGRSSVLWCAGLKNAYEAFHLICSNKGAALRGWFSTRYLRNFPSRPTLFAGLIIPVQPAARQLRRN